jgi:segregation and condensation protein A
MSDTLNDSALTPMALVYGEPLNDTPSSLYIPPTAMRVLLEHFAGPLDLLLYLVRKHRFDIMDIPMTVLCRQYAAYVEEALKIEDNLEIAADYLTMAAFLVEIKSKMLLPKLAVAEDEEDDPRADLVRRLLEYERIREAAQRLGEMPRRERDFVSPQVPVEWPERKKTKPVVHPEQLASAFWAVLARARQLAPYKMRKKTASVRELMSSVLRRLAGERWLGFRTLVSRGLPGISFLAVLQLAAEHIVSLHQPGPEDELFVQLREN